MSEPLAVRVVELSRMLRAANIRLPDDETDLEPMLWIRAAAEALGINPTRATDVTRPLER